MRRFIPLVLCLLFIAPPAFGWHVNTHLQMTRDAISLMPPEFQKIFTDHQKLVEAGIRDPDELLKDWQNHYYIPSNPPEGGGIDRIDKLCATIQTKLNSGNASDVSRQFAYLAHYIGDLWTPEYLIKQNTGPDAMFIRENEIVVFFEGYNKPIENFHDYFMQRVQWRWTIENSRQISTLLYSEAVNDIAQVWLSLWQSAGHTVDTQKAAAILHKSGVLSVNFERLLLEEGSNWSQWGSDPVDNMNSHMQEMKRLSENVAPSSSEIVGRAQLRTQQAMLSKLTPTLPFTIVETSLKVVGQKNHLICRIRNHGTKGISSLSMIYPGIKGPVAQSENIGPGQVVVLEAQLPLNATRDQLQFVFAVEE